MAMGSAFCICMSCIGLYLPSSLVNDGKNAPIAKEVNSGVETGCSRPQGCCLRFQCSESIQKKELAET